MTTLDQLVPVKLIYDAALGSPPETAAYANVIVMVPPDLTPLPQRGRLLGQPGFSRQNQVTQAWEWVLQGDTDPVDQFVDSLTGRPGWVNTQSRAAVKLMIQRLFSAGIPRTTIQTQIPQFYQAVAAEVQAEQSA